MMTLPRTCLAAAALIALAGCGTTDPSAAPAASPVGAMADSGVLADARALLGTAEEDLDGTVRVRRAGDETFYLTQDMVPGRTTVELDDTDGDGTLEVTVVTVETDDGPQTVSADDA